MVDAIWEYPEIWLVRDALYRYAQFTWLDHFWLSIISLIVSWNSQHRHHNISVSSWRKIKTTIAQDRALRKQAINCLCYKKLSYRRNNSAIEFTNSVWNWLFKVADVSTNRKPVCNFLLCEHLAYYLLSLMPFPSYCGASVLVKLSLLATGACVTFSLGQGC